jgi:hypothetical protein
MAPNRPGNTASDPFQERRNQDRTVETVEDTRRAGKAIDDITQQTKENLSSIATRGKDVVEEQKGRVEESLENAKRSMAA